RRFSRLFVVRFRAPCDFRSHRGPLVSYGCCNSTAIKVRGAWRTSKSTAKHQTDNPTSRPTQRRFPFVRGVRLEADYLKSGESRPPVATLMTSPDALGASQARSTPSTTLVT